jgi:hypothetical protein
MHWQAMSTPKHHAVAVQNISAVGSNVFDRQLSFDFLPRCEERSIRDCWWLYHDISNAELGPVRGIELLLGGPRRFFGGASGKSRCFVGANQEKDLSSRNYSQQGSEDAEDKGIERNRVFPSPIPDYRKPLPEGFGWLILGGFGIGAFCGLGLILLFWRSLR